VVINKYIILKDQTFKLFYDMIIEEKW